jgi:hypothetical protein
MNKSFFIRKSMINRHVSTNFQLLTPHTGLKKFEILIFLKTCWYVDPWFQKLMIFIGFHIPQCFIFRKTAIWFLNFVKNKPNYWHQRHEKVKFSKIVFLIPHVWIIMKFWSITSYIISKMWDKIKMVFYWLI